MASEEGDEACHLDHDDENKITSSTDVTIPLEWSIKYLLLLVDICFIIFRMTVF